ncbi:hypothetical protein BDZ89DRAFT_343674 [Hymenopellis radicata]|nr:hypothetical protein BDZ89DRAFT_343674 [Hymenopellis radicata]
MPFGARFKDVFVSYGAGMNLDPIRPKIFTFRFDGDKIQQGHIPAQHDLEDGDQIDVFVVRVPCSGVFI